MVANALDQSVVITEIEGALMGKYYTARGSSTGGYLIVSVTSVNTSETMTAAEAHCLRIY
jgi:hypothetical protein